MSIITNFSHLQSMHEAARLKGANSREWIEFAVTMMDSFPALYNVAEAMNDELAKMRQAVGLTSAVRSVIAERQRQVVVEGWSAEHDDKHDSGELAGAAACYARHTNARGWVFAQGRYSAYRNEPPPSAWPFDFDAWKPTNPRRDLVKAGALILAEIERMDRTIRRP